MRSSSRARLSNDDEQSISKWLAIAVVVAIGALVIYEILPSQRGPSIPVVPASPQTTIRQPVYIPNVVLTNQTKPMQTYNTGNILKDSLIVTAAGASLVACTDLTFGVCAAAGGSVAGLLDVSNDQILTVSATFTFTNIGNATATGWSFKVFTYINGHVVSNQTEVIPSLQPLKSSTVTYSKDYNFGSIPTLVWNTITSQQDTVTFAVQNIGP